MKRLTPATVTFLMFGVVGLLVAVYVAKSLFATEAPKPPKTRTVPMAVAEIPAGTLIKDEHLGVGVFNESELKPGMLLNKEVIVNRIAKANIKPSWPMMGTDLYEYGVTPPLKVSKGNVAITISVGEAPTIVDALIKPGDYADVHFQPQGGGIDAKRMRGGVIVTLLKGVKILTINRQTQQAAPQDGNTVTLELTPVEAQVIDLAKSHGALTFRYNPQGKGVNNLTFKDPTHLTLEEILGLPEVVDPKPPTPFRAQVYRQSGRTELEFSQDGRVKSTTAQPLDPVPAGPGTAPDPIDSDDSDLGPSTSRPQTQSGRTRLAPRQRRG